MSDKRSKVKKKKEKTRKKRGEEEEEEEKQIVGIVDEIRAPSNWSYEFVTDFTKENVSKVKVYNVEEDEFFSIEASTKNFSYEFIIFKGDTCFKKIFAKTNIYRDDSCVRDFLPEYLRRKISDLELWVYFTYDHEKRKLTFQKEYLEFSLKPVSGEVQANLASGIYSEMLCFFAHMNSGDSSRIRDALWVVSKRPHDWCYIQFFTNRKNVAKFSLWQLGNAKKRLEVYRETMDWMDKRRDELQGLDQMKIHKILMEEKKLLSTMINYTKNELLPDQKEEEDPFTIQLSK